MKLNHREKITKLLSGTMFYGVLANFVILVWMDKGRETDSIHDPYILILFISMAIGFLISFLFIKNEKK